MGTIKFEVDIPDFEKEISINVVIKKDGEVAYSTTSSPSTTTSTTTSKARSTKKNEIPEIKEEKKSTTGGTVKKSHNSPMSSGFGGNMMNIEF